MGEIKSVMDEEFRFIPEKAGREVWAILGILAVVAAVLMAINTSIEGEFDVWSIIMPVVFGGTLAIMWPQVRFLQRSMKYKTYLRKLPEADLHAALQSNLDSKSKEDIERVLARPRQQASDDNDRTSARRSEGSGSSSTMVVGSGSGGDSGGSSSCDGGSGGTC